MIHPPKKEAFFIFILISIFISPLIVLGQPQPCGDNSQMTPTCEEACIICDINGFTGINNSNVQGEAPDGFCTTVVHNITWIAFIAGTENITLEVFVFNCQNFWNEGLEVGIYETLDCENTQLISICDGSIGENTTQTFSNNQPLTIGQYYYFVMDGGGGSICNYTVTVTEGSTEVAPLSTSGFIEGPINTCPNVSNTYSTTGEIGATFYDWTLDGAFIDQEQSIDLLWGADAEGVYELCVTASNVCDDATSTCQYVVVESIPPTILEEIRCEGECVETLDGPICETGQYEFNFINSAGCDSLVYLDLTVYPNPILDIQVNLCEGDSIYIGEEAFFQTGTFSNAIPNFVGCDSTVNLDLNIIICEIETEQEADSVLCFGGNSGSIDFFIENGTPPFNYDYQLLSNTELTGTGNINNLEDLEEINNLLAGTYAFTVNDDFGNDAAFIIEVSQPAPLIFNETVLSDYNGSNVSCDQANDGSIFVSAMGGVGQYNYTINGQTATPPFENLNAGTYQVVLSDVNDCETEQAIELVAPMPLQVEGSFFNANCTGLNSGQAQASVLGGTPPYSYSLDGSPSLEENIFSGLGQGNYELTIQDGNGCNASTQGSITAPQIPIFDLGPDTTIVLGNQIPLTVNFSGEIVELNNIEWNSANIESLDCTDCLSPTAFPVNNATYSVSLTSLDNCTKTDTINIFIDKQRSAQTPTAFTPNGDGLNDVFYLFGDKDIAQVNGFKVFSRWGQLLFEQRNFPPNDASFGWDGRYNFKNLEMGVYVWYAEVAYIDGATVVHKGNVTLIR